MHLVFEAILLQHFGTISPVHQNTHKIRAKYVQNTYSGRTPTRTPYKGRKNPYKGRIYAYKNPYRIRIFKLFLTIMFLTDLLPIFMIIVHFQDCFTCKVLEHMSSAAVWPNRLCSSCLPCLEMPSTRGKQIKTKLPSKVHSCSELEKGSKAILEVKKEAEREEELKERIKDRVPHTVALVW